MGITFVHVTHDQEEAMTMADTVAVMNKGVIEQMGAPEELYELPRTAFVANFLGQSNLFTGDVVASESDSITVDIAGVGNHKGGAYGFTEKGATGATVRSLIAFAEGSTPEA